MRNSLYTTYHTPVVFQKQDMPKPALMDEVSVKAFEELEQRVRSALETYSNVHRGTGHYSMISTALFERAKDIVLEHMGLEKRKYAIVFCSAYYSEILKTQLHFKDFLLVSSQDIGLPLGLRVLAIKKSALPKGVPLQTGGGVAKMVSRNFVIWADASQKLETGTPCIINAIAFAIGLIVKHHYGSDCFRTQDDAVLSATDILYHDELSGYTGLKLLAELQMLLVGRDILVPTREGEASYINFDNAASTPTFYPVWNAVKKIWRQSDKIHEDVIREVRNIIAGFLGANRGNHEIIFTCNTSEAINMAARFIKREYKNDSEFVILNTLLEHNSNELPWRYIPGASLIRLSVNNEGFVDLDELELILRKYNLENVYGTKRIRLVSVSGASNVLGTYNDIQAISTIVHKYNASILVDGAQLVAHRAVNIDKWDIDYFAFSGHKVYAPFGSGALLIKKEHIPISNAELEKIKTSGEENITGIGALGKAIVLLQRAGMEAVEEKERVLTGRLLKGIARIEGVEVYGIGNPDSGKFLQKGGIVSFRLKEVSHHLASKELAEQDGIGVRYGCFCSHLLIKHLFRLPPVIEIVQNGVLILVPPMSNIIPGLIRVSLGIENNELDIERLIAVLENIVQKAKPINRNVPAFHLQTNVKARMDAFYERQIHTVYSPPSNRVNRFAW